MNDLRMFDVIRAPHFSEKGANLAEAAGQHVFKVALDANKLEVKKAIESIFSVKVEKVRMVKVKGKTKRFGQAFGRRSDWKKAYVTLAEGHDIDFSAEE